MQQATVNLFADMNAQPANLQAGPGRAVSRVERRHAPTAAIITPAAGATLAADHGHHHAAPPATPAAGWSRGSKCRPTVAPPGIRPRVARAGRTPGRRGSRLGHGPRARRRRQRQHPGAGRRSHRHGELRRGRLPVHALAGARHAQRAGGSGSRPRSSSACIPHRTSTAASPGCVSTRARATPAPTSAHLWSAPGTLLGTATFGSESASGWQQVQLRRRR